MLVESEKSWEVVATFRISSLLRLKRQLLVQAASSLRFGYCEMTLGSVMIWMSSLSESGRT